MKISASESKPFQSCSKGKIPSRARRKEWLSCSKLKQAFLIDSDAKLFMYLIQCIRFGSWKLRHLNQALLSLKKNMFYHLSPFASLQGIVWSSCQQHNTFFSGQHILRTSKWVHANQTDVKRWWRASLKKNKTDKLSWKNPAAKPS